MLRIYYWNIIIIILNELDNIICIFTPGTPKKYKKDYFNILSHWDRLKLYRE